MPTKNEVKETIKKIEEFKNSETGKLMADFCNEYAEHHEVNEEKLQKLRDEIARTGNKYHVSICRDMHFDSEPTYKWNPTRFWVDYYDLMGSSCIYNFENFDIDKDIANCRKALKQDQWDDKGNYCHNYKINKKLQDIIATAKRNFEAEDLSCFSAKELFDAIENPYNYHTDYVYTVLGNDAFTDEEYGYFDSAYEYSRRIKIRGNYDQYDAYKFWRKINTEYVEERKARYRKELLCRLENL